MAPQLRPSEFADWRDGAAALALTAPPIVLDVREPWELQVASVKPDGFLLMHIPMRDIPARVAELQQAHGSSQPIACLCHHGLRSMQVANFLAQTGFTEVVNLEGGIEAWSQQVDATVPFY